MPHIAIVGAGISGLVTAKTFLEEGYDVTVFEKDDEVGGVWTRSRRYPGIATQNPRDTYAFSDFPMPPSYPDWPAGEQVQAYLAAYADHFGVTPRIRLATRVDEAAPRDGGGWRLRTTAVAGPDAGRSGTVDADWLVVCNGVFSEPHVPEVAGRQAFEAAGGRVLHTTQVRDAADFAGERVVIVGFAKSAADVACALTDRAARTTLLFRRAGWKVPKHFFGFLHLKYVLTTRFSESLFRYHRLRGFERVLHTVGRPLVWLFWRGIERALRRGFSLDPSRLVPDEPIERVVACNLSLASDGFYEKVRDGRLRTRRGEIRRLVPGAVEMEGGGRIEADAVVFGTGFRQTVPFLGDEVRSRLVGPEGEFRLHRNILPLDVPRLAFVGYNSSFYSQLTSEIGARWLAEHVRGAIALPPRAEMAREIDERWAWAKRERPNGLASGTCIVPFNFHYLNGLLDDMGARTWRTRNRLREYLMPVDPSIYADLREEIESRRRARQPPREPALARSVTAGRED
jgi:dimethylaniline monooxygenase (N-oxide forming)